MTSAPIILDGADFQPAGSSVVLPKMTASGRVTPELLNRLGMR